MNNDETVRKSHFEEASTWPKFSKSNFCQFLFWISVGKHSGMFCLQSRNLNLPSATRTEFSAIFRLQEFKNLEKWRILLKRLWLKCETTWSAKSVKAAQDRAERNGSDAWISTRFVKIAEPKVPIVVVANPFREITVKWLKNYWIPNVWNWIARIPSMGADKFWRITY